MAMATVTETVTETKKQPLDSRFVLHGVSFATYMALREDLDRANVHTRLTFDRGTLELMTVSFEHEHGSRSLFALILQIATELDIPLEGGGSTTFAREDLDRGIEPDECFYIANAARIQGQKNIDLTIDPPPDLAIEIDVSRSSIDKMAIYAALGVPEFWRLDDGVVRFHRLGPEGRYEAVESSPAFPFLGRTDVEEWLRRRESMSLSAWTRAIGVWARETLAPRHRNQPGK
jgi:Uma2 family endonuclease